MKNAVIVVGVSIIFLVFTGAAVAQDTRPAPQLKKFEPVMGKWSNQEESRPSPDAAWDKGTSEWEFRLMPGGFFVETPGSFDYEGSGKQSFIQLYGWDTVNERLTSWAFDSDGFQWQMTSGGWSGTTLVERWIGTAADGTAVVTRCTWNHTPDYTSVTGRCEQLTDGKWWTQRRTKGKKVQ